MCEGRSSVEVVIEEDIFLCESASVDIRQLHSNRTMFNFYNQQFD